MASDCVKIAATAAAQKLAHPADTVNFGGRTVLNHTFKCTNNLPKHPFENF